MQDALNLVLSTMAAGALSYVVISSKMDEGAVTKIGLIAMVFGLLVSAMYALGRLTETVWLPDKSAYNAALVLRAGIVIVCFGYYTKFKRRKRDGQPTDWQSLTER